MCDETSARNARRRREKISFQDYVENNEVVGKFLYGRGVGFIFILFHPHSISITVIRREERYAARN
jgi:hypothetical protein